MELVQALLVLNVPAIEVDAEVKGQSGSWLRLPSYKPGTAGFRAQQEAAEQAGEKL